MRPAAPFARAGAFPSPKQRAVLLLMEVMEVFHIVIVFD